MIEIRTPFGGWKSVTRQEAEKYMKWLFYNMPAIPDKDGIEKKAAYINENRLRGITVEELLCLK